VYSVPFIRPRYSVQPNPTKPNYTS
jgi:hypothetical protein